MRIELKDGAGGEAMEKIIREIISAYDFSDYGEVPLSALDDSAVVEGVAFTTDSYTVRPIFFPGGDIGRLAISGTVNDLCAIGAKPMAISTAMIVEEGFSLEDLKKIVGSMASTAKEANVAIVTGDFKVVEKGSVDKIFITASGIGKRHPLLDENLKKANCHARWLMDSNLRKGDKIIITGYVGDHGIAVMTARGEYGVESNIKSDVAPLHRVLERSLEIGGVVALKDPTRGGVAEALNEWSLKSKVGIELYEKEIPVREEVASICELLGIDPLTLGNEGKFLIAVRENYAEDVLECIRELPESKDARIIGEVTEEHNYVVLRTEVGGRRIVERPIGDPVPRIC